MRGASPLWSGLLVVFLLAGCGGGGGGGGHPASPPTISNLNYSPTAVPVSASGTSVTGSVDFADSGGDLSTLTLTVTDASGSQVSTSTTPIQGLSGQTAGTIMGGFQVSAIPVGIYTIHVTVTDSGGIRSNELTGSLQIVAVADQATVVATTGPDPMSLVAANGSLYWSESGTAALRSVAESGGPVSDLATRVVNIQGMAFAGSDVVWEDDRPGGTGPCTPATTRVISRTTAAGVTTVLASGYNCGFFTGSDVVIDGSTVYWISSAPSNYVINATPTSGGATTTVASSITPIVALAGGSGTLYWMENMFAGSTGAIRRISGSGGTITTVASGFGSASNTFALDASNVYYTTPNYPRVTPPFTETLVAQSLAGGAPVTVSSSISTPTRLVAAAGQVLWIDAAAVNSVPAAGGPVTVLASTTITPLDLLINGSVAMWSETNNAGHGETGAIKSVPLAGGATTIVYQGGDAPRQLALDSASELNWTEGGPVGVAEGFSRIARITPSNTVQTVLAGIQSTTPAFVASSAGLLIADVDRIKQLSFVAGSMPVTVAADSEAIAALTFDSNWVYWDSAVNGSVRKAPIGGGTVTTVATPPAAQAGAGGPIHLASNGDLYWVSAGSLLLSVPAAGGTLNVVGLGPSNPANLIIDSSNAYFGGIMKVPLSGGMPAVLVSVGPSTAYPPLALDIATSMLYWLDGGISKVPTAGGSVMPVLDITTPIGSSPTLALDGASVFWTEPGMLDIRASAK